MKPRTTNRRITLLAGAFVVFLGIALGRAFWLQAVNGDAYAAMAVRQHRETVVVPAGRGTIFDRNGEPLAIGEQATTVFANPQQVDKPNAVAIAAVKTASTSAWASSAVTDSRHCVHASPKAPGVANGVVFQGHAPLSHVTSCHPSCCAMRSNVEMSW